MEERNTLPMNSPHTSNMRDTKRIYMPAQTSTKGLPSRKNQVMLEVAQTMINEKHMPRHYWFEATCTVTYLMNQCTTDGVHEQTPYEKYIKGIPTYHM
jgi:hypothetical protein